MPEESSKIFDTAAFLCSEGPGRTVVRNKSRQHFFTQGGPADCVFYLRTGRAKLTVVSQRGKEATVSLLAPGDFFGEESMVEEGELRSASAIAVTVCVALRIERTDMLKILHQEHVLSHFFMQFILARGIRTQADLVDQLFNSSERRLARLLLLMAEFGQPGEPVILIPKVTQEALADLIGTTRSRVSFFMNRFRKLGYIEYNGRILVNKSLLNMVLHDALPEENATRPKILDHPLNRKRAAKSSKLKSAII